MKKSLLIVLVACSILAGCDYTKLQPSFKDEATFQGGTMQPQPNFAQFKDIPIPEKAVMDLKKTMLYILMELMKNIFKKEKKVLLKKLKQKKTMLFGNDPIIGRLAFSAPYNQSNLFDFYMQEMPKFGWSEITMIRSANSVLTFSKENRIATIQLATTVSGSSDVIFDISFGKVNKGY